VTVRPRFRRLVAILVTAAGLSVALAGTASAHDVLISSSPADKATVATAPSSVTFTFDQPVQNFQPVVSLIGPDGKQYSSGSAAVDGNTVTGTVSAGPPGAYTAAFRIVSADGHPVTGEIHFTVSAVAGASGTSPAGNSTAITSGGSAAAAAQPPAAVAGSSSTSGLSGWLWIGLVVAALLVAVAVVLLVRRPTAAGSDGAAPQQPASDDKDY